MIFLSTARLVATKETSSEIQEEKEGSTVINLGRSKGASSAAAVPPEIHVGGGRGPLSIQMPAQASLLSQSRFLAGDRNLRNDDLATSISQDPILTLELLRVANAIAFTQDRPPITTARTALIRLGSSNIVEILNNTALRIPFSDPGVAKEFENLRALARRISIVSRIVSMTTNQDLAEEAQTVGLMSTIGQMVACAYFGSRYVELAQSVSPKTLAYRLSNDHNFDIRSMRLSYLRQHGLPEVLIFAFDRELAPKSPERLYLRVIADAATELVEAFDHNKWERYQDFTTLPGQSALRIFQLPEPVYYRLYDRVEEYLSFTKEEEDQKHRKQEEGLPSKSIQSDPAPSVILAEKLDNGTTAPHADLTDTAPGSVAPSVPLADTLGTPSTPSLANGKGKKFTAGKTAQNNSARSIWDAVTPVFVTTEQVDLRHPPRLYSQKATAVLAEVCGLCTDAHSAEELLKQLLQTLTNSSPFIRAALITLATDKRSACVHVAVGTGLTSGATIALSDPLSPLATCLTQVRSFNAQNAPNHISPLGVSSFAVSPIRVDNNTPVFLYADCGSEDSLTFEARRIFRYIVGLLNQVLPNLPGGLP